MTMASLSTTIKKWISRTVDKPLARIIIDEGWGVSDHRRERWLFYEPLGPEYLRTEAFVHMRLVASGTKRKVSMLKDKRVYYDGCILGVWKKYNPDELPRLEINERARPRGFIR